MDRRRRVALAVGGALLLALIALWWGRSDPATDGERPLVPVAANAPAPAEASPDPTRAPTSAPTTEPGAPDPVIPAFEPLGDPPEGVPGGQALCALDPPLPAAAGHLVVGESDEIPYDGRRVQVAGGVARLPFVAGGGRGVLAIDGYAPVPITWSGGGHGGEARCQPDPVVLVAGDAWITGRVSNAEDEPEGKVFVEGCGNQARTDADGTYAMTVAPGRCTLGAFRRDGLLTARSQAAEVEPVAGQEIVVDFDLPELPRAGLGIVVRGTDDGIRILDTLPGTAAADLGLVEGDLVVEVDGTPTAGIDLEDFIDLAVGPVGTDVQIVVEHANGQTEALTLDRRELEG